MVDSKFVAGDSGASVLIVDDILISLEMGYRIPVIKTLLEYATRGYQLCIFTHDRAFYEMLKRLICSEGLKATWIYKEMYASSNSQAHLYEPRPIMLSGKEDEDVVECYMNNHDYPAAANAMRKLAEKYLHSLLPMNLWYQVGKECINKKMLASLFTTSQSAAFRNLYDFTHSELPNIQPFIERLMNPLSHDDKPIGASCADSCPSAGACNVFGVKYILVLANIILILTSIVFSLIYSHNLKAEQEESELDTFCTTIESMKQISDNYLRTEIGYVKDWAQYIDYNDMTVDEALAYINAANHQEDRYAHIVDMQTFRAYTTYGQDESDFVSCYQDFYRKRADETYQLFIDTMQKMISSENEFHILGKYRTDDTQTNVISVGTKVQLKSGNGEKKEYLLLRVIPVESIRKIWVFPIEYMSAEVGIITKSGAYVIPSKSMKSLSFSIRVSPHGREMW